MYRWFAFLAAALALLLAACSGAAPQSEAGAIAVGQPAPDFSLPSATGETVSLSQYESSVLLYFHMAGG